MISGRNKTVWGSDLGEAMFELNQFRQMKPELTDMVTGIQKSALAMLSAGKLSEDELDASLDKIGTVMGECDLDDVEIETLSRAVQRLEKVQMLNKETQNI